MFRRYIRLRQCDGYESLQRFKRAYYKSNVTLRYITLHYITLHYINITLHCVTFIICLFYNLVRAMS